MSAQGWDAIVIGAGANGLVAAASLGRAGRRVLLVERSESLGGQGQRVEFAPGFRAAPLGLDPGWLPPRVASELGLVGLETATTDLPLSVAAEPGRFLTLSTDAAKAGEAIRSWSAADAARWPAFTARLRKLAGFLEHLYQVAAPDVDARSLDEWMTLLGLGRAFRALGRTDMIELLRTLPMSVWELLDDWFETAALKAAVAAGGVQDFQQGPRSGGTGFVLLHHLVGARPGSVRGRVPWRAGPSAFTDAAEAAARRHGVSIRTGSAVAGIRVSDDRAIGVTLEGGEDIDAGCVLSTMNPARTLLGLVDPVWLDPEFLLAARNIRHRGCTAFVLYALDGLPEMPGLSHHDALAGIVSLTPSLVALERAADAAKYRMVSEPPHVELTAPTLLWPDLAPPGKHVLVARVQYAPYRLRDGQTWDRARREELAESATKAIERVAPGFASRILHRVAWTPRDLEERFGLREGAPTHGELGLDQILFMRPVAGWGRHGTPIEGLYLGSAGTHPGPGILGGSGWLAARRLLREARQVQGAR